MLGGDLINLKIKPEVSSLDFNNAVVIEGFRIPALTTRRAETEVELQDGQTFAIAGLLNNTALSIDAQGAGPRRHPGPRHAVQEPRVSEGSDRAGRHGHADDRPRGSFGVSSGLPSLVEPFLGPNEKPIAPPAPYVGSPLYPVKPGGGERCARAGADAARAAPPAVAPRRAAAAEPSSPAQAPAPRSAATARAATIQAPAADAEAAAAPARRR